MVAAAASFLEARQSNGLWLVRIEDIDPPREMPGAAADILRTLERLQMHWDGPVLYQSTRTEVYRTVAEDLVKHGLAYRCRCTRSELRSLNSGQGNSIRYPGTCRDMHLGSTDTAIRVRVPREPVRFDDALQGPQSVDIDAAHGDYLIYRRDKLPAYHLAVVLDDAEQHVTHVVRGADLLDSTALHIHLQSLLALVTPSYCHVPVLVDASGQKLSKQTGAVGVDSRDPERVIRDVLRQLGLEPPSELRGAGPDALWRWATASWDRTALVHRRTLPS